MRRLANYSLETRKGANANERLALLSAAAEDIINLSTKVKQAQ